MTRTNLNETQVFTIAASGGSSTIHSIDSYGVCTKHFLENDYTDASRKRLKSDATPSIECHPEAIGSCQSNFTLLQSKVLQLSIELAKKDEEIKLLRIQLIRQKEELENATENKDKLNNILQRFTGGQQRMLADPTLKSVIWSESDLLKVLPLFNLSLAAYEWVRENLVPLPSQRTMFRHLSKMQLYPDQPIQSAFSIIRANFGCCSYWSLETLAVISLDEMSLDSRYCYDAGLDQVFGGQKNVTLFCVRGLASNWKEPIMYSFEPNVETMLNLCRLCFEFGLNVVGIVSDLGPKNRRIWRDLKIGKIQNGIVQNTGFRHPMRPKDKIWWFPDFPHLLKRLRDHVLDSSITLPQGTVLDRTWFEKLINVQQKHELKLTCKLGLRNLYLKGQERQNCATAFQLWSHTTASAIRLLLKNESGCEEVADFIDMVDKFSDIMNSRSSSLCNNVYSSPLGTFEKEQLEFLTQVKNTFMTIRIGKRKRRVWAPFQKGMIMLIESVIELYSLLDTAVTPFKYILTSHLNQDFLENAFSTIRSFGGHNANPNGVEFRRRLRKLLLKWNLQTSKLDNISRLTDPLNSTFVSDIFNDSPSIASEYDESQLEDLLYVGPALDKVSYSVENMSVDEVISEGSKEYIAGFISKKMLAAYPNYVVDLNNEDRDLWVSRVTKGGLYEPSDEWLSQFCKFEEVFRTLNPHKSIDMAPGVVLRLSKYLRDRFPDVPSKIIDYYSRVRNLIRIKFINKCSENEKYSRQQSREMDLGEERLEDETIENKDDVDDL